MRAFARNGTLGRPAARLVLAVALAAACLGVVRAVYLDRRVEEAERLKASEAGLRARLEDYERGARELSAWTAEEGRSELRARRARPARTMVSELFRAIAPVARRHGVSTEVIEPSRALGEEVVDVGGGAIRYQKAELRFRMRAGYRELASYLGEVEALDQVVLVRSVGIRFDPARYPRLDADVVLWIYGTI